MVPPAETGNTLDVIIVTKPHFRNEEQHGNEIANEHGRIGNQMYVYLDFKIGRKTYSAWWRSHTFAAPVYLAGGVRYKFRLRLERQSSKCQVVAIWEGDKLIWVNPETQKENIAHRKGLKTQSVKSPESAVASSH
jgi:hypothetical protein